MDIESFGELFIESTTYRAYLIDLSFLLSQMYTLQIFFWKEPTSTETNLPIRKHSVHKCSFLDFSIESPPLINPWVYLISKDIIH